MVEPSGANTRQKLRELADGLRGRAHPLDVAADLDELERQLEERPEIRGYSIARTLIARQRAATAMTIDPNAISPTPETGGGEDAELLVERVIIAAFALALKPDSQWHDKALGRAKAAVLARLSPPSSSGEEGEQWRAYVAGFMEALDLETPYENRRALAEAYAAQYVDARHPHSGETK